MKGAAPDVPSTTRIPRSSSSTMTGVSHHFLLWRMKYQNSAKNPDGGAAARRAKSSASCSRGSSVIAPSHLPEVAVAFDGVAVGPIRRRRRLERAPHRIVPPPHQQPDRRDDQEI